MQEQLAEASVTLPSIPQTTTSAAPSPTPESPTATNTQQTTSTLAQETPTSEAASGYNEHPSSAPTQAADSDPELTESSSTTGEDKKTNDTAVAAPASSNVGSFGASTASSSGEASTASPNEGSVDASGDPTALPDPALSPTTTQNSVEDPALTFDPTSSKGAPVETSVTFDPAPSNDPATSVLEVGGFTLTASPVSDNSQAVAVGTEILSAGGPAVTVSDHLVTHGSDGLAILSDSQTVAFTQITQYPTVASVLVAGGVTVTASTVSDQFGAVVIGQMTISEGGPAATISGHVITQGSDGLLLQDSQTLQFSEVASPTGVSDIHAQESVLAVGSLTITASAPSGTDEGVVIDGTTLSEGGPIVTKNGQTVSCGSSGLVLVDAQSTVPFTDVQPLPTVASANEAHKSALAVGSLTITALAPSGSHDEVLIDGTTLSKDGIITRGSQTISYGPSGLVLVDAQSTAPFTAVQTKGYASNITEGEEILTLGSLTVTAISITGDADAISVHGTSISEGGSAIMIGDATLTMGASGLEVIKSDTTEELKTVSAKSSSARSGERSSTVTSSRTLSSTASASLSAATATSSTSGAIRTYWHWEVVGGVMFAWLTYAMVLMI